MFERKQIAAVVAPSRKAAEMLRSTGASRTIFRKRSKHVTRWLAMAAVAVLCGISVGCFGNDFDETKVRLTAEGGLTQLDSEQVSLSPGQVDCGVDKDLWEAPVVVSGERSVARLKQAARDMGFSDDVSINEPGYNNPYAQVRGKFMLHLDNLVDIKEGPGDGAKTVIAQLGVKISHDCFPGDLPIMGIRKGQFNASVPVTAVFLNGPDGWYIDHFVH